MTWAAGITVLLAIAVLAMLALRARDRRHEQRGWDALLRMASRSVEVFDPALIRGLPEPAQRYLQFAIKPGAPLHTVVEIAMRGKLGLGTKEQPGYRTMSATQLLAPPHGLIWKLKAGPIGGSDGMTPEASWTRFWLLGLFPVVRAGGNRDHYRSAFGRVVSEGAFWVPASLLPSDRVRWEPVAADTARAVVRHGNLVQAIDLTVAADGQPQRVVLQRWSNVNAEGMFREQPFGGELSNFQEFDGFRLPTRVEGGNHIGTDAYFPFYKAEVTAVRFPAAGR